MVRPKKNSQRPIVSVVETGEVIVDPTKSCPKVLLKRVPIPPNGTVKLESKQESSFTPRISARLQKKGKFSVRKLLGELPSSPPPSPTPVRKKKRRSKKSSSPPRVSPKTNSGEEVLLVYKKKEKLSTDENDLTIKKKDSNSEYLFGPEITISPIVKNSPTVNKSIADEPDDIITISEGNTGRRKVFTSSTKPSLSTASKFEKVNKVQPRVSEAKEKRPVNINLLKLQDNKEISVSFINKNTSSEKKDVPLTDSVVVQSSTKVKKYYELKPGSSNTTKEKLVEPSKKPQLRPKELQSDGVENLLGKKTAKVTPLTQEKNDRENSRSDAPKISDKIEAKSPKSNLKSSPTSSKTDTRLKSPGKRSAEQSFEKFFITKQSVCEHNESLDSDSEEEVVRIDKTADDDITVVEVEESSKLAAEEENDTSSIYDLMQNISMELPAWNLHILEDTNSFCIAHVVRGPVGIPVMKKIIEIDADYNAKVFINQAFRSEFRGVYDSYESIRDLIYSVDRIT